jgi:hypothetical protein
MGRSMDSQSLHEMEEGPERGNRVEIMNSMEKD